MSHITMFTYSKCKMDMNDSVSKGAEELSSI